MNRMCYQIFNFYSWSVELYKRANARLDSFWKDAESLVLDGTFSKVVHYDFFTKKKTVVRDNTRAWRLAYLLFLKYVVNADVHGHTSLATVELPSDVMTITEVVYLKDKTDTRMLVKTDKLDERKLLRKMRTPTHKPFLFANVFDTWDVTRFVNSHLTSFDADNHLTMWDVSGILFMDNVLRATAYDIQNKPLVISLVDSDTLEVSVFKDSDPIVLTVEDKTSYKEITPCLSNDSDGE
jgi:hypothetical protein